MVIGQGDATRFLSDADVRRIVAEGFASAAIDGKRLLVLIPDATRTMPMPLMFEALAGTLGPRAAALDYLVALGTHQPMSDEQLGRLVGRPVADGRGGPQPRVQPPVGSRRHVRDARDDSRRGDREPLGRAAQRRRPGVAQQAAARVRPPRHLRPGVSARGRRVLGRHEVSRARRRRPRHHQLHPLARRRHHQLRGHRRRLHARAGGHRSRRGDGGPADELHQPRRRRTTALPGCTSDRRRNPGRRRPRCRPARTSCGWTGRSPACCR